MISALSTPLSSPSPPPRLAISAVEYPKSIRFRPPRFSASTSSAERPQMMPSATPRQLSSDASLYEVLGIPMRANRQEIKAAYRRLARIFHPDVMEAKDSLSDASEFMKVHAAYSTLSDPDKRSDYHRRLFHLHRSTFIRGYSGKSASTAITSLRFSSYTGRNWETDQCW